MYNVFATETLPKLHRFLIRTEGRRDWQKKDLPQTALLYAAQSKEFTDTAFYHCSEICNILVKFTERQIFTQACLIYKLHNKLATHMVASGQTIDFFEWRATKVIQQKAYLYLFSLSSLSLSLPSFITKIDESPLLTFIIKWSKIGMRDDSCKFQSGAKVFKVMTWCGLYHGGAITYSLHNKGVT